MHPTEITPTFPPGVRVLISVELLVGLAAVIGGVGVMLNGLGMPVSWLADTPFQSYFLPGLLLTVVVGGVLLLASYLLWIGSRSGVTLSFLAGLTLNVWIVTQIVLIGYRSRLQAAFYLTSLLILALTWLLRIAHGRDRSMYR